LPARVARELRVACGWLEPAPNPPLQFLRSERLLIRVPALSGSGDRPRVTAQLLDRSGKKMWHLAPVPGDAGTGVSHFDLPLAPLAPGDYILQFTATSDAEPVEQRVSFKVTG